MKQRRRPFSSHPERLSRLCSRWYSNQCPAVDGRYFHLRSKGSFRYGVPALLWLMEKAIFPGVASSDIYLHPVARAAWIGLLATSWNLLPIGQLDGGHILFSLVEGIRRRAVGREIYERVSVVGIALFLILLFIGLSNDINRLHGG